MATTTKHEPAEQLSREGHPRGPEDAQTRDIDALLDRIEMAVGEFPDRREPNATLITEILHSVNGLRTLLGVKGTH